MALASYLGPRGRRWSCRNMFDDWDVGQLLVVHRLHQSLWRASGVQCPPYLSTPLPLPRPVSRPRTNKTSAPLSSALDDLCITLLLRVLTLHRSRMPRAESFGRAPSFIPPVP